MRMAMLDQIVLILNLVIGIAMEQGKFAVILA
jgi:hypothetical protein